MRFASDNAGPVHPMVMKALEKANESWAMPYGNDDLTRAAENKVRDLFEAPNAAVYFVATGTAANAILLATLTAPFQSIFCTPEAHIEEDECNAPEFYTSGAKLTLVASEDAKMLPHALVDALGAKAGKNVHIAQSGPVSLTQLTESGTLYSLNEISALTDISKAVNVPVHMDGARFANAIAALDTTPAEMTWKRGIDAVSFGGTKNGLMGVEAAVIFNPDLAWEFELRRKRGGHLFSKNRYLAAQMLAYLTDDLWLDMARSANQAGQSLANALRNISGVSFIAEPAGNMVFARFPRSAHQRLHDAGAEYYCLGTLDGDPDELVGARLVCDWSCPLSHITEFVQIIHNAES